MSNTYIKPIYNMKRALLVSGLSLLMLPAMAERSVDVEIENSMAIPSGDRMKFSADIVLDALDLKSNRQIFLTPILESLRQI